MMIIIHDIINNNIGSVCLITNVHDIQESRYYMYGSIRDILNTLYDISIATVLYMHDHTWKYDAQISIDSEIHRGQLRISWYHGRLLIPKRSHVEIHPQYEPWAVMISEVRGKTSLPFRTSLDLSSADF